MLTSPAKICVKKFDTKNKKVIDYKEKLEHDGYDKDGPESDLWNLYILYTSLEDGEDYVDWYHWENWFEKDNKKEYEFVSTHSMYKLKTNNNTIIAKKILELFKCHLKT